MAGLAASLLLGGGARAGEPRPAPLPVPAAVFPAEAISVEIDALVTDAAGQPVRGLTRQDFEVFEEGVRQEIAAFAEVAVPIDATGPGSARAAARPRDVATNETGGERRVYVIVLDEAHIDPRRSTAVRQSVGEFIERHMGPADVAAVVFAGGRDRAAELFTADKRRLAASVGRFAGRAGPPPALERARTIDHQRELLRYGVNPDTSALARSHDARASLATLVTVARWLQGMPGRRKAILFFSEGLEAATFDVRNVVGTAARGNVAIYALDPRGLGGGPGSGSDMEMAAPLDREFGIDAQSLERDRRRAQTSLRVLADETGGAAVLDTNDLAGAFERIVRASSHYYLLGYKPMEFLPDGAFRRVEVRVRRPGLSVAARKGYARPRGGDRDATPELAAAAGTSAELRELLHRPWAEPGLTLGVTAAAFKVTNEKATVALVIHVPGPALATSGHGENPGADGLELSLVAVDAAGRVHAGERMVVGPAGSAEAREVMGRQGFRFVRRLELPPGAYQLRVAARAGPGRRGSVFYDLEVPRYAEAPLAISGVLLTSRAAPRTPTPSFDAVVKALLESPPTVARTFAPDDILTVYAEVYDTLESAHDLAVTTRLTNEAGREILQATDRRASTNLQATGGGLRYKLDLPLAGVPPGAYVLRVEARPTVGTETVARELSFDVLPNVAERAADVAGAPAGASEPLNLRPASRIDRLTAWLAALEGHVPGVPDGPARMVRSWPPADLRELAADVTVFQKLLSDPKRALGWVFDPARPGPPRRSPYAEAEEERLRTMAGQAAARCGGGLAASRPALQAAAECARVRIARRGAVLHTDAAVLFEEDAVRPQARGDDADRVQVRFRDGQQNLTEQVAGHWELAQVLLDGLFAEALGDEAVRLWYLAAAAYGQYHERHTRLEDRAAQLFPSDPQVLFFAGTLHETFASPRIQRLVRSLRLPAGTVHAVGSERSELRKAEELFRRALRLQPESAEARLRLGRVLHRLGAYEAAVRELRQVSRALSSCPTPSDDEHLLAYYAAMFLGAAEEALGRPAEARAAYAQAAAERPHAPTPQLALSRVALSGHDRAAALAAVREALSPSPEVEREDPWWHYHVVQGREFPAALEALRRSLEVGP